MKPTEMKVDNIKRDAKSGKDKSVLKGVTTIEGVEVQFDLTATCDALDIFEVLGIDVIDKVVNMRLEDGFQQSL